MPVHYQFLRTFRDLGRKHRQLGWFSAWRGFCCNVHPCRDLMNQSVPKAQLQNSQAGRKSTPNASKGTANEGGIMGIQANLSSVQARPPQIQDLKTGGSDGASLS